MKQLNIVKKIEHLVSSVIITKKQIMEKFEKDAKDHLLINRKQESDDQNNIKHAREELHQENLNIQK